MGSSIALDAGGAPIAPPAADKRPATRRKLAGAGVAALLTAAAYVAVAPPYTAGSDLGYNLGLAGGVLMLLLLPYALRKRLSCLRQVGTMRGWFLFHIAAGLLGPLLVLFHCTFRIGSLNGGVALACTLLVTASGAVGRFFYRKVHRGLTGSRATLDDVRAALDRQMEALAPQVGRLPEVGREVRRFLALAEAAPAARWQRIGRFVALGGRRRAASRRIRRALGGGDALNAVAADRLLQASDAALLAAQRAAQFSTYERLFARWHVVHIPFLYLLVLTAVVHVVAVHAY